ncbi:MAG TPA: hypothetical protein VM534_10465, partial [Thermoanaerobaculia bacterium]|nr:hypothetical protein [Thermoanaerobaculia bacterium]
LEQFRRAESTAFVATTAEIADRRISAECDDRSFFSEFFMFFGGPPPTEGRADPSADMHLSVRTDLHPDFGCFRINDSSGTPLDGREFTFALGEEGIFARIDGLSEEWRAVSFRDDQAPAFAFNGKECLFALQTVWRRSINWFLLWRLMRIRSDAIFFHASAMGIGDEGTIFVGPKGGGKSTTALSLAARGHNLLSDEIAGYQAATGNVVPFRRPVGIKPGPRCAAVSRGLDHASAEAIDREGFIRVDVETLFQVAPARPYPLRRIVFLRGFEARPDIIRIEPGRAEIAELQPLMSSFLNASHSQRVFELIRLLSTAKVYRLHPGDPDETAEYLEEVFGNE